MARRKLRWRIILPLLTLLIFGWAAWRWFTRPVTMRLVQTIPLSAGHLALLPPPSSGAVEWCALDVHYLDTPAGSATITLLGWDSQPGWSVTTPLGHMLGQSNLHKNDPSWYSLLALSPDGRILALVQPHPQGFSVTSWHGQRTLGKATIPWPTNGSRVEYNLQVTASGRVWVYVNYTNTPSFNLWAIDGSRVAQASFTASATAARIYTYSVSPGGTGLLCNAFGVAVVYMTLAVHGDRVIATRRYTLPMTRRAGFFRWLDDRRAVSTANMLIGPDGLLAQGQEGATQFYPAQDKTWQITTNRYISDPIATADGRTSLIREGIIRWPGYVRRLPKPLLRRLRNYPPPRLALYTAPGRLRAVLPNIDDSHRYALSPDGRRIAFLVQKDAYSSELRLYEWGK